MKKLLTLVLILACHIIFGQCPNCLTNPEMDYFIACEANMRYLANDTTIRGEALRNKNNEVKNLEKQVSNLEQNEADLKIAAEAEKAIAVKNAKEASECKGESTKKDGKINRRTGGLVGSIALNVLLALGLYLSVR